MAGGGRPALRVRHHTEPNCCWKVVTEAAIWNSQNTEFSVIYSIFICKDLANKLQSCAPISAVCHTYYNKQETLLDRVSHGLVPSAEFSVRRDWCRGPWPRILVSRRRIAGPRPGRRGARWCIALCFNVSLNINTPAAGGECAELAVIIHPWVPVSHAHTGHTGPIVPIGVGGGRRGTLAILWQKHKADRTW